MHMCSVCMPDATCVTGHLAVPCKCTGMYFMNQETSAAYISAL